VVAENLAIPSAHVAGGAANGGSVPTAERGCPCGRRNQQYYD